jgi:WD40 repeat protein
VPALIRTLNRSNSLALSPDGKLIASAISTQINLLDAKTGAPLAQSREFPNAFVRFSPGGKWLLAKTVDRKLGLLETNNGLTPAKKLIIKKNTQPQDRGVCMTPDGRKIVNLVYEDNMLGCISV